MIKTIEFEETDSTNSEAKRYIDAGGKDSLALIAHCQSKGRGQGTSVWESSSKDGLYYTLLLNKNRFPASLSKISNRVLAKNVQQVIEKIAKVKTKFKEPNDIYLEGKKLGGILIEYEFELNSTKASYAIIGIGLNLNQKNFSSDLSEKAISLYQHTEKKVDKYAVVGLLNTYLDLQFPIIKEE